MYKIELWGANGSDYNDAYLAGKGGYTSGYISLDKNTNLYVYVGQSPEDCSYLSTYNGGGAGNYEADANGIQYGYAGGGSTDIRLVSGDWNNFNSLKSRIMVAAAGGGAGYSPSSGSDETFGYDGHGGGLIGYTGEGNYSYANNLPYCGVGATQTLPGGNATDNSGKFGYGGYNNLINVTSLGGAGGGSGYYGGGASLRGHGGGGGGSSFISGHNGCDAITESSIETNIVHTGQSIHYSGYQFHDTIMIDGAGYNWTTEKGTEVIGMPTHDGTGTMTGNDGNGYAKITLLEVN